MRFVTARSTRDLDFTFRAGNTESALDHLQRAGACDIGDFFSFRVGEAMMDLEAALTTSDDTRWRLGSMAVPS